MRAPCCRFWRAGRSLGNQVHMAQDVGLPLRHAADLVIIRLRHHPADAIVYGYAQAAELARAAGFARSVLPVLAGREERPLDI